MMACGDRIFFMCLILDLLSKLLALDGVSISRGNPIGPMIAGEQYDLQCFIHNVAESAVVRWFKGRQTIFHQTFNSDILDKTYTLTIHPKIEDDGAQFRCEVELKAGLLQSSEALNITVVSKPIINDTKLPSVVPVFRGYPVELVCEADGKPKPTISWKVNDEIIYGESLNITEFTPETLYCVANNSIGRTIREVKVVLKEDYLPLIAGLVAITVAFISVFFVFIYSIYYKTAKMGRYSLKDAKPCAQNRDIAQNGKDNTIPMKKLSQSSILA